MNESRLSAKTLLRIRNRFFGSTGISALHNIKRILTGDFSCNYGLATFFLGSRKTKGSIEGAILSVFNRYKIDLRGTILDFGTYQIPNFLLDCQLKNTFIIESKDLTLPQAFGIMDFCYEGPYEDHQVRLSEGDVVLDCGANLGLFSAYAAGKGCKVYAFEPVPAAMKNLLQTISLYPGAIEGIPWAISHSEGTTLITNMVEGWDICRNSILEQAISSSGETVEVPMTSIDRFVEQRGLERVDFIKADIEGAERWMLEGAKETLKRFAPKLSICAYHLPDDVRVLKELIMRANPAYRIRKRYEKLIAYVPKRGVA